MVNPYQMAAINGRYYLIGNYDKYNNIANYRGETIPKLKLGITVKADQNTD